MLCPRDLDPIRETLAGEARRHAERRRAATAAALSRQELSALMLRLGAAGPDVDAAVEADDAARLSAERLQALRMRMDSETARLARQARSRDPRYDLNRHIAVSRLARWLTGGRRWSQEPAEAVVQPGRVLNDRFRRNGKTKAGGVKEKPAERRGSARAEHAAETNVAWPLA
ncbi:hypothetical protein [Jiella sp. M17.18]|uniref:hypothetical protein n=1 Tax=Jiella sp. M17.18 TaxID=3234247 RepID=UPI0034DEE588